MSQDHHVEEEETTGPKVLAVSDRHPRVRSIAVVRPAPQDASFLAATAKGIGITIKHFARNLRILLFASPITPVMFFSIPNRSSQKTVSLTG